MRWIFGQRPPKNPRGWIVRDGDNELGVVDLGSTASLEVRHLIDRNRREHGKPFETGGALSASCLPLMGAGSVAASSLAAGNVFLATANPATLMSIGGGVGSAVMGTGGIVAQAPFIAASTAILPVVAPLAIFMTVSSTMMSGRFDRLQTSLDSLNEAIHFLMKREVNEDYAQVLSALARLQDIAAEWELSHRFTQDMKIRLALVERDLSVARYRHDLAIDEPPPSKDMGTVGASAELKMRTMPIEQHLFTLSSVVGIHAEGLRLRLAVQENSPDLARRIEALDARIEAFRQGATGLLEDNWLERYQQVLEQLLQEMGWSQRKVTQRKRVKALENAVERAKAIRDNELAQVRDAMKTLLQAMAERDETARQQSIVYYRDENGKGEARAYYTVDLHLEPREDESVDSAT